MKSDTMLKNQGIQTEGMQTEEMQKRLDADMNTKNTLSIRKKALLLAIAIIIVDQITKVLSRHYLAAYGAQGLPIFEGFSLVLHFNTGAAFGFLAESSGWQRWFFVSMAGIITTGIIFWLGRLNKAQDIWEGLALALILGGALGNLWDRLFFGNVTDFILLYYKNYPPFPTFNIADSAISVGVVLFAVDMFRKR